MSRAAWRRLVLAAVVVLAQPSPASAQLDSLAPVQAPPAIRWWHGAIVLGGLSALLLLDQPTERFLQNHRSGSLNDIARTVRHLGQPEVYGTVTVGLVAGGLLSSNDNLTRAGGRLAATLLLAGATSTAGKLAFGRPRPNENPDADVFVPFSGQDAMPSGHSTIAFALAGDLAEEIHKTWATVGLYTLASGVAWSRLNDNRHWLSDVAAGAVIGITSAKLVHGRWRIFNLRPPQILIGPRHAGIAWQVPF